MANTFYHRVFNPLPGQRVDEQVLKDEFQRVELGFDGVQTAIAAAVGSIAGKANLAGGNIWTGAQDFTAGTLLVAAPTLAGHPASKQYVDQTAFSTVLPGQPGRTGKYLRTNGTTASWEAVGLINRDPRIANTMLVQADERKLIDITTGSFAQTFDTPSNLGAGWWVDVKNSGSGVPTLAPTIDGVAGVALRPGDTRRVYSDGTVFRFYATSNKRMEVLTSGTSWTAPPGCFKVKYRTTGGGGGGAGGGSGNSTPGSSAGYCEGVFEASPGTAYTYAIGAAGTSPGTNFSGTAGGNTTIFGTTATGGLAGVFGGTTTGILGGAAAGGQINTAGQPVGFQEGAGSSGKSTPLGSGGAQNSTSSNTAPATGYGSSGAVSQPGRPGVIILEYEV